MNQKRLRSTLVWTAASSASAGRNGHSRSADAGKIDSSLSQLPGWKRAFDLVILIATFPLWLPLMVTIMYGIKIVSPGPVFFRQKRIGFRGRPFMLFKFRSMKVNAETQSHEQYLEQLMAGDAPMTKLDAADQRLIPFGCLFRASGLDELPQLFNVLRGEMSLVGPRPCTEIEFARYRPEHKKRVNAPPGLTGYWQVHGKNRTTFDEMIAMDIQYGERMSLGRDLAIVFRTLPVLVGQTVTSLFYRRPARHPTEFNVASASAAHPIQK